MTFLFVDRILCIEDPSDLVGIKHITVTDQFLERDSAGKYYLQDAIVGETLGQLAAWYVIKEKDFRVRPVAGIVDEVQIHGHAYIGDTMELHAHIDHLDDDTVQYHAQASVNGKPIFTIVRAIGPLVPMESFSCPKRVEVEFSMINHPGELASSLSISPPVSSLGSSPIFSFLSSHASRSTTENTEAFFTPVSVLPSNHDTMHDYEKGVRAIVSKSISLSAPYFKDHFANNPVFPMSLLLQCQTNLAIAFIQDMMGDAALNYALARIYKVKMKNFIRPGNVFFSELLLKEVDNESSLPSRITLQCFTEVEGKRVCVSLMDFIFCAELKEQKKAVA